MFYVMENGKPCNYKNFGVDTSWDKDSFSSFEEAQKYSLNWVGEMYTPPTELNVPVALTHGGADDFIIITDDALFNAKTLEEAKLYLAK